MKSKFFAVLLSILGGGLLVVAININAPFSYDPLGPKPFPVAVSISLLVLPFWIVLDLKQQYEDFLVNKKVLQLILTLCLYFISFEILGFMLSTIVSTYLITRIVGSSRMQGLLTGLIISIVFYGVFHLLFKAPLPLGQIYEVLN